jgi:ribosomal protein S27AE
MDEDKVLYCPTCLSLQIMGVDGTDICYCGKCGSTDIKEIDFDEWDKLYQKKYGKKFMVTKKRYFT